MASNNSQQKIKNEATGRRVLCMLSERASQRLARDSTTQLQLLTVKPSYPHAGARGEKIRSNVSYSKTQTFVDASANISDV